MAFSQLQSTLTSGPFTPHNHVVDDDDYVVHDDDGDNGLVLFPASEHSDQRPLAPHSFVVHSSSFRPLPPG